MASQVLSLFFVACGVGIFCAWPSRTSVADPGKAVVRRSYTMVEFKLDHCPAFSLGGSESPCPGFESFVVKGKFGDTAQIEMRRGPVARPLGPTDLLVPLREKQFSDEMVFARLLRGETCTLEVAYPTVCTAPDEKSCPIEHTAELRASYFASDLLRKQDVDTTYNSAKPLVAQRSDGCPWSR